MGNHSKEYIERLLAIFGDDVIIDVFKYDKIDQLQTRIDKLKEELHLK